MQHITSTPLAAQAGAIAAAIRAEASQRAAQAGMVAALHALILSALARLVTSLENLVQLWQAGLLPSPRAPAVRHATPGATSSTAPLAAAPSLQQQRARHPSAARDRHAPIPAARRPAIPTARRSAARAALHPAPEARHAPPDFPFFGLHVSIQTCA